MFSVPQEPVLQEGVRVDWIVPEEVRRKPRRPQHVPPGQESQPGLGSSDREGPGRGDPEASESKSTSFEKRRLKKLADP